jgi:hypothetical protein
LQGDAQLFGQGFGFNAAVFAHGLQKGQLSGIESHGSRCGVKGSTQFFRIAQKPTVSSIQSKTVNLEQ